MKIKVGFMKQKGHGFDSLLTFFLLESLSSPPLLFPIAYLAKDATHNHRCSTLAFVFEEVRQVDALPDECVLEIITTAHYSK